MSNDVVRVENLAVSYGGSLALQDVTLGVAPGSVVALLGRNGVGKSTTLRTISGILRRRGGRVLRGRVLFDGQDITSAEPATIVRRGLVQVLEGRHILPSLSVRENLRLGAYSVKDKAAVERSYDRVLELFPPLVPREKSAGGLLSGGEQQMLAIGRALMSEPRVVLMDEPSLGLAPRVVTQIGVVIRDIAAAGVSVILVEQNANMALSVADTGYVLDEGRVVLSGPAAELREDAAVVAAYVGVAEEPGSTGALGVPSWTQWLRS
jgi:branched-chain amino acid transport system ATP-binding protein